MIIWENYQPASFWFILISRISSMGHMYTYIFCRPGFSVILIIYNNCYTYVYLPKLGRIYKPPNPTLKTANYNYVQHYSTGYVYGMQKSDVIFKGLKSLRFKWWNLLR